MMLSYKSSQTHCANSNTLCLGTIALITKFHNLIISINIINFIMNKLVKNFIRNIFHNILSDMEKNIISTNNK